MTNRTIKHEIKLQPSVIVILGILAVGVSAIAFAPMFSVKKADAAFRGGGDGMIIEVDRAANIWQLNDGKVRYCRFPVKKENRNVIDCTEWKK